jgi:hypothetical protein
LREVSRNAPNDCRKCSRSLSTSGEWHRTLRF